MEKKIEVGDYIRTIDGTIAKIIGIYMEKNENCYYFDNIIYRVYSDCIDFLWEKQLEEYIVKHSKKIIDLIEVGDYVNGYEVKDIDTTYRIGNGGKEEKYLYMEVTEPIYNNFIVTVLTKEMFERVEYRVGE